MLRNENIDQSWSKVLLPICTHIANVLRPELHVTELWDIRNYVNVKKLPGGAREECGIIFGTSFSKNVAHKGMATKIDNPKILLLECPIVYQRIEEKYISLEALQLQVSKTTDLLFSGIQFHHFSLFQEKEYLRNVVGRILSLKPNIVIVHKSVSGIAQDLLRKKGITVVVDVKLSVLDRLSRCFQCDIVSSIDSNIGEPKLGTCGQFVIKKYANSMGKIKSIMILKTNTNPRSCSILLRGAELEVLVKLKRVAMLILFARFNWRFESSFLSDEFGLPDAINPADSIENDENSNENVPSSGEINHPLGEMAKLVSENRFTEALKNTILSISPNTDFPLPYLETDAGRKCILRSRFPTDLFYCKALAEPSQNVVKQRQNNVKQLVSA